MPKRPNPFGDCSPLQFKSHIGRKEVDSGVCREENMKLVFERTRQLLYNGAQKQAVEIVRDANHNQVPADESIVEGQQIIVGQMCIDKHLNLTQPSNDSHASDSHRKLTGKESLIVCCVCKKQVKKDPIRCCFCDKGGCRSCFRQCYSCCGEFCHLCSVVNYEESFERNFCLNCSS